MAAPDYVPGNRPSGTRLAVCADAPSIARLAQRGNLWRDFGAASHCGKAAFLPRASHIVVSWLFVRLPNVPPGDPTMMWLRRKSCRPGKSVTSGKPRRRPLEVELL